MHDDNSSPLTANISPRGDRICISLTLFSIHCAAAPFCATISMKTRMTELEETNKDVQNRKLGKLGAKEKIN